MLAIKVKAESYIREFNERVGVQLLMIIYLPDSKHCTYVCTEVASVKRQLK